MRHILVLVSVVVGIFTSHAQTCNNEDFELGDFTNWRGFTGRIDRNGTVTTPNQGFMNGRHTIMSGGKDPVVAGCVDLDRVEASGLYSVRLGNSNVGAQSDRLRFTFTVEPGKEFFMYKYAVVLQDPRHRKHEQPRFEVRVFDKDGNLAPCGKFEVTAGKDAQNKGFVRCGSSYSPIWVKDWTVAGADLSAFVGEQVTIDFMATDCSRFGHFGYAYVEASCKKLDIAIDGLCAGNSVQSEFTASVTEGFKSYKWSNGQTGPSAKFTNLNFGDTIRVEVTTFTGCSNEFEHVLGPPDPVIPAEHDTLTVCKDQPFALTASGENFGFIKWDHIQSTETTLIETVENDTAFGFEYFDRNGCSTGLGDTIQVKAIGFDLAYTKQDVTCSGLDDGQIEITVTGADPPFKFDWQDGETGASRSGLKPGTYHVTVTNDGVGCTREVEIELIEPGEMVISADIEESSCELNNGKIQLKVTGGVEPYRFTWADDPAEQSKNRNNLPAGTYTVVITDNNGGGCARQLELEVEEPTIDVIIEPKSPHCAIDDGSLLVLASGGSGDYTYTWDHGATGVELEGLTAGNYSVTVRDDFGCETQATAELFPPPPPLEISVSHQNPICTPNDGFATVNISGGLEPYEIAWDNGATTELAEALGAGSYNVTVMDANECMRQATVTIDPPPPFLQAEVFSFDAVCTFDDGRAELSLSGGTPPYNIAWADGRNTERVDSLTVGDHEVIIADANGCEVSVLANIGPPNNLMELTLEAQGESYQLKNGAAWVDVTGGLGPYFIQWLPTDQVGSKASNLTTGFYEVLVRDQNGCLASDTISVPEIPPIDVPNAFTPNGDEYNEFWKIKDIEYYPEVDIQVFNRWGNLVFESKGYLTPWHGESSGAVQPMDTYYYIIDLNIGVKPFRGYVDVIR